MRFGAAPHGGSGGLDPLITSITELGISFISFWATAMWDSVERVSVLPNPPMGVRSSKGSGDRRSSSGFEGRSPHGVWGSAPWGFGGS